MIFFVFDRLAEEQRLDAARKLGMTLLKFPIIRDTTGSWRPYSRVCGEGDELAKAESIIAARHEGTEIDTGSMIIKVSDYYAEVIDRDWVD